MDIEEQKEAHKKLARLKDSNKKRGDFLSRCQREDIKRLLARGKSPADIAVWLNIPMSSVLPIQQELTECKSAS